MSDPFSIGGGAARPTTATTQPAPASQSNQPLEPGGITGTTVPASMPSTPVPGQIGITTNLAASPQMWPPGTPLPQTYWRRDTAGAATPPHQVAGCVRADSVVRKGNNHYEWVIFGNLTNYSPQGENVAVYGRAIRGAAEAGATWGGVFETRDVTGKAGHQVAIEADVFGNGPDTSNSRVGVDVSIGAHDPKGLPMEATYGVRVGPTNGEQRHRVKVAFGADIDCDVAFDASRSVNSTGGVAMRMRAGQRIALEETNQITISYNPTNGHIEFKNGSRVVGFIDSWHGREHEL